MVDTPQNVEAFLAASFPLRETSAEAMEEFIRREAFSDYAGQHVRQGILFPHALASPTVLEEVLKGLRLFMHTRTIETRMNDGSIHRTELMFGREFDSSAMVNTHLPALLGDGTDNVLSRMSEPEVITDHQERVDYSEGQAVARGIKRRELVEALIAGRRTRYGAHEIRVARDRPFTEFIHQTLEWKPSAGPNAPALARGMYFLCIPYRIRGVYPSMEEENEWVIQKAFIMCLDYAELERLRWTRRETDSDWLVKKESVAGIIRGTRAIPYPATDARGAPDIGMRSDYTARSVQFVCRHAPGDTTYVNYTGFSHYEFDEEMPEGGIWEERIPVPYEAWLANTTEMEKAIHERDERVSRSTRALARGRVPSSRYYVSLMWEMILLGTDEQLMQDDRFWARDVVFLEEGEPDIVDVDDIPEEETMTVQQMRFRTKSQYQSISRFISEQRARATQQQRTAMDTSE